MSNFWYILKDPNESVSDLEDRILVDERCKGKEFVLVDAPSVSTLVSGRKGEDTSLIPKIQDKMMIIDDWDKATRKPDQSVLSILRSCYDGRVRAKYGNGVERDYQDINFDLLVLVSDRKYLDKLIDVLGERLKPFFGEQEV